MCAEAFARSAEILPRCSEASASLRCAEDVPRLCRGAPKCAEVRRGAPRCEAGLRDERDRLGDLGDLLVEGGADEHALDPQLVPRNLLHAQRCEEAPSTALGGQLAPRLLPHGAHELLGLREV